MKKYTSDEFLDIAYLSDEIHWIEADGDVLITVTPKDVYHVYGITGSKSGSIIVVGDGSGSATRDGSGDGSAIRLGNGCGYAHILGLGLGYRYRIDDGSDMELLKTAFNEYEKYKESLK